MSAYILRRLLLIVPTLFGIMAINFIIVQAAPGGPVEQMIAQIKGMDVSATARVSGGSGETLGKSGNRSKQGRRTITISTFDSLMATGVSPRVADLT